VKVSKEVIATDAPTGDAALPQEYIEKDAPIIIGETNATPHNHHNHDHDHSHEHSHDNTHKHEEVVKKV